ncbi:MAG: 30S ribosomal protein S5 [Phycisphaeraceae bacterium]|nr:30S ribosomal protein S5 [Phycisphaeraceae bacterium]
MAEMLEESTSLESTTVYLWRNAKVVKGGRRFSLSALVVVGDRRGSVGIGYGKAAGAPAAIEKAQKNARKNLVKVVLKEGTIPHEVLGAFCASRVKLIPAAPGTGVKAGGTVRAVLEMAGVRDCLTKAYGSTNQKNLVKATLDGLQALRTTVTVGELRGLDLGTSRVDDLIEAGRKFVPQTKAGERAKAPVNTVGQKSGGRGGRGGRGGGGGGRGRGRGPAESPAEAPAPIEAAPPAGAPEQPAQQ